MNEWLLKKFSLGVSFGYITSEEQIRLFDKYSDYIHDVFFSPTESIKLQTRLNIYNFNNTTNNERLNELDKVIQFVKRKGIRTSLVLNASMSSPEYMMNILEQYYNRYAIDSVTTTKSVAKLIRQSTFNLPIVCSYNEGISNTNDLSKAIASNFFDSIVLGNSFIRNFPAFSMIKKHGLNTILLVNNGCSFGCTNFCRSNNNNYCKNLFNKRIADCGSVTELYAHQSLFPEELFQHYANNHDIDILKLSSRPISYTEYDDLLQSYTSCNSRDFINKTSRNYHLYARLGHFGNYYKDFDYDIIIRQKEIIWHTIKQTNNQMH